MSPPEVDGTKLWKLAAFLGTDIDRRAELLDRLALEHHERGHLEDVRSCPLCAKERGEPIEGWGENVPSGRDVIAERYAHERGEAPAPDADALPASMLPLVQAGFIGPTAAEVAGADTPG